jgi:hypothetical protein
MRAESPDVTGESSAVDHELIGEARAARELGGASRDPAVVPPREAYR